LGAKRTDPLTEDDMTTPRTRPIVSFAAVLSVTLAFGACAGWQSRGAMDPLTIMEDAALPLTIRFDNGAPQYVHVYLIADQQQWLLGRVEPGAKATLRIPEGALVTSPQFVQLAVLTGERLTLQAARDPRATLTAAQPTSELLAQRWTFAQGHLASLGPWRPRVGSRQ
jgi:hypothetical protein